MNNFDILDLQNHTGRIFVVGDIHGMFTLLEQELEKLEFDVATDILLSVGDLVDRGPESHRAIEFVGQPWFHFVRGNHEDMCKTAGGRIHHVQNGGAWFNDLADDDTRVGTADLLNDAPVVMEVLMPDGQRIGVVHADFPTDDWNDVERLAHSYAETCMWSRDRVRKAMGGAEQVIKNIDAVYFGHTPLKQPFTSGNCHWIDTGAVFGGKLTIVRLA